MPNFEIRPCAKSMIVGSDGSEFQSIRKFAKHIHKNRDMIASFLKENGFFKEKGVTYTFKNPIPKQDNGRPVTACQENAKEGAIDPEFEDFIRYKDAKSLPFEKYDFKAKKRVEGKKYAIALFSDAHIEETVTSESVLGKNEYNLDIAKDRIENYFTNLANCINADRVERLIFASLGDTISGFIHDELSQTNGLSPLEATFVAQNLIYTGLDFLCSNTKLKQILFIGIVGNHSRTTKKIQHSNGYKMSYEWLMYKNIEQQCKLSKLPIEFNIPESELAIVDADDDRRFIFCHGFQIKGGGTNTICGIYPSLQRYALRLTKTFQQDRIYMGHFHSCVSIPAAAVNGSIIGYNSFSMTNGFEYQEPCQYYEVIDTEIGQLLERKIYCR